MDAPEQRGEDAPAIPAEELDVALAQVREGQVVPGEAVLAWLRSWGTPDELPAPVAPEVAPPPWR